ncbi:hypothetical protein C6W22_16315 [Bacillus atrophaeus]|nr:hypothetical protein C6W22_16315 [Bacillus atrophaeus]
MPEPDDGKGSGKETAAVPKLEYKEKQIGRGSAFLIYKECEKEIYTEAYLFINAVFIFIF